VGKLEEVVRLLRAQILISNKCIEKIKALKETLQAENKGADIVAAVQAIEPALLELGKLEKDKQEFLRKHKMPAMSAFITKAPPSEEREIVVHLLHRVQEFEEALGREIEAARLLLERGKKYVDYHINVMTRTVASETYTQDAANKESRREIKMFDSSV
jgi:hypothetical protein